MEECRNLNIEILKPDINKSLTKFTVENGKIRFGLGSIKNVGNAPVDAIVKEREKNGKYRDFIVRTSLAKYRDQILKITNISTIDLHEISEQMDTNNQENTSIVEKSNLEMDKE